MEQNEGDTLRRLFAARETRALGENDSLVSISDHCLLQNPVQCQLTVPSGNVGEKEKSTWMGFKICTDDYHYVIHILNFNLQLLLPQVLFSSPLGINCIKHHTYSFAGLWWPRNEAISRHFDI